MRRGWRHRHQGQAGWVAALLTSGGGGGGSGGSGGGLGGFGGGLGGLVGPWSLVGAAAVPSAAGVAALLLALAQLMMAAQMGQAAPEPALPAPLSGPLPVLLLATSAPVPNEPKAPGVMLVGSCGNSSDGRWGCCLGCGPEPALRVAVGVELRGRSSQAVRKKSYSLELRSSNGSDLDLPLLGLPPASGWLLQSLALDRSLLRDALAFQLARLQGRWAPRSVFVELWVVEDGSWRVDASKHYRGIYAVTEPISRGPDRVDISKLTSADPSGGMVLEIANAAAEEWWASQLGETMPSAVTRLGPSRVDFKVPGASKAPSAAWGYASSLLEAVADDVAAAGGGDGEARRRLGERLDLGSLVDFLLHTELTCDYDGYVSSVFFFKDRGGPLVAGPVWDKNLAFGNEVEVASPTGCGWRYAAATVQNSGAVAVWMGRLAHTGWWRAAVAARWRELRSGVWSPSALASAVDALAASIPPEAASRNFGRWPLGSITSQQRFVTLPGARGSWQEEVAAVRWWLQQRASWLDAMLTGDGGGGGGGGQGLAAPAPPNLVTGMIGAVLGGRPITRAFREGG
ncbi:hypothetical protein HYH03_006496 [Edaphochlamys debaryana]|uniref:Uncharacterized protein n=1 Tax=Edaphochlamys debaryana TaxID=47281 RepID=A0A836C1F4_9CHLO|nr:hypothetical protein HYH03_006496 [Edaphochlamys debaryana]|eukprot:KAG2495553.1 hypothetical protein HYH03_006496 [Edaphochlamys debaryana]